MKERDWIRRYIAPLAKSPGAAGLTDDVAELRTDGRLVITTDMLVEGCHFLPNDPIGSVAQKLVRVNVSDLYAKGALPLQAVLSVAWPDTRSEAEFESFAQGLALDLETFGLELVGGDLVSTPGPTTLNLAATGRCLAGAPVRRSGAHPGHALLVSGPVGFGRAGLAAARDGSDEDLASRYRVPQLASRNAVSLVAEHASASLDVSDGLLLDALRMAEASEVSVTIDLDLVPLATPTDRFGHVIEQCTGGDDYQILMAAPADVHLPGFFRIGEIKAGAGLDISFRGQPAVLPDLLGYEH